MACAEILILWWTSLSSLCAIETCRLEEGLGRVTGEEAQCLIPSSSLQTANRSSALSRLVPVTSPASTGSQQAINMLKEQNRLLTKVSGGTAGGHALGVAGNGRGWDGAREGMTGSGRGSFSLTRLGHPREGCMGCTWRPSGTQLCPAVCWVSQWQGWGIPDRG